MCKCVLIPIKSCKEEGTLILLQEPVTKLHVSQLCISSTCYEGLRQALLSLGLQGKPAWGEVGSVVSITVAPAFLPCLLHLSFRSAELR